MLTVTFGGLRSRWTTLVTTVLTLALGVALIAAMGLVIAGTVSAPDRPPQRYAAAPVVVTPTDELRVVTANGVQSRPLAQPPGLPPGLVARLRSLGPVVVDRVFYAELVDGDAGRTGRPWSAARLGRYELAAGRAPRAAGEVVVGSGAVELGRRVTVLTTEQTRTYTVVGLTAPVSFERVLFFSDAEAARLSPRVDAVASFAAGAVVRAEIGDRARVRTGARRRALDPDSRADSEALVAANSVAGTAGGVAGFVAVFVIASTFAYAVATRRRELALLRTAGATPGQIRRSVVGEGLVVGVVGSVAGCALGHLSAPWLADWLVDNGMAPTWFTVPDVTWPLLAAFAAGLVTAVLGAASAARRAGRVRPVEVLREATIESSPMTPGRWIGGLVALGGALFMLAEPVLAAPAEALKRKHYLPMMMLLLFGVAMLAPLLAPPVARLLRMPGASGLLARQAALTAARRTAAVAAPVLLTVGLVGCVLTITATITGGKATEVRTQLAGDYVVEPTHTEGLNQETVERIQAVPGIEANPIYPTTVYAADDDAAVVKHSAHAVARPVPLPVVAGNPGALDDDSIVVDTEFGWAVGNRITVWVADGSPKSLRVVAVVRAGVGGNGAYLSLRYAGRALAEQVQVRVLPGARPDVVRRGLEDAVRGRGGVVRQPDDQLADAAENHAQTLGLRVILGLAVLFSALSIVGTTLMAARDRRGELELLRLSGATPAQMLLTACAEAVLVAVLGLVLAAVAVAVSAGALWLCLLRLVGEPMALIVPWRPVAGVGAVCVALTVLAAVPPTVGVLRRRPGRQAD